MEVENIAITVIDSIMGSGKTQAMYQMIRNHPEKSFMIVTPYLKTIQDAKNAGLDICEPEHKGETKLGSLKYLLSHGYDIGCTHSLFLNVDNDVWNLIRDGNYTLFIDEALDVVKPINDLIDNVGYQVKQGTAKFLLNAGIIKVDEFCRVTWCGTSSDDDYEYRYLEPLVRSGNVLCVNGQLFLWMFPPQIFNAFEDIYILSYLFEGSVFDAYLKIHDLKYELGGVSGQYGSKEGFVFTGYKDDAEQRKKLKELINIYEGVANGYGEKWNNLSESWYDRATASDLNAVRNGFNTFYKKVKSSDKSATKRVMWTAYKRERDTLKIDGAKYIRKLTSDERKAMEADPHYKDQELNKLRCFVSCNAKATNDYADRQVLAYLINRFYNPNIENMFRDNYHIKLSKERFALSEMIQWIWRSSIRRHDLPDEQRKIDLYIPSRRMRSFMRKWLDGQTI